MVLVIASYLFYGWWDYRFCALILVSSLVDYAIGNYLGKTQSFTKRNFALTLSLTSNLGLLGIFKYFGFFADNLRLMAEGLGWSVHPVTLNIILPVGISFYTFQTLSYTIDIYRKQLQPANSLVDYLAFVSFFPQLVAGPIERGRNLLPQFHDDRRFNRKLSESGCRLILWGFFKKLAIADPLAVTVDQYYGNWQSASGVELCLATLFFAFQIYCDFSAYSDIAIGTARLFSIRLMRNFAYPYFSQSIGEFWRRWHISLSTWFRDYVYIPLGGNRVSAARRNVNLMLTFLLSGLWHGAAWTFVAWGGVHGAALAGQKLAGKTNKATELRDKSDLPGGPNLFPRPMVALRIWLTFSIVCCGWVFFRAETIGDALGIFYRVATDAFVGSGLSQLGEFVDANETTLIVLGLFVLFEWVRRNCECPLAEGKLSLAPLRWSGYTVLIWGSLYLIADTDQQPFVYFAFLMRRSMRNFLVKLGGFVSIQLAILIWVVNYGSRDATSEQYLYALKDKYDLLVRTEGPRVVFVGGSNLAFGINSNEVKRRLGRNPINLGLHERLGINVLLRMVREQLRKDDVILISPEFSVIFEESSCSRKMAEETISCWPASRRFIQPDFEESLEEMLPSTPPLRALGQCVARAIDRSKGVSGDGVDIYRRKSFNQFGDHVAHFDKPAKTISARRRCPVDEVAFGELVETLNQFQSECEERLASVYFLYPPVLKSKGHSQADQFERMNELLNTRLNMPVLFQWEDAILEDSLFYDSEYHLTEQGALRRTVAVCEALSSVRIAQKSADTIR